MHAPSENDLDLYILDVYIGTLPNYELDYLQRYGSGFERWMRIVLQDRCSGERVQVRSALEKSQIIKLYHSEYKP